MVFHMGRPKSKNKKVPTNLSLSEGIKNDGTRIARQRYGISLTELVERLLIREVSLKRGQAHVTISVGEATA